ncbi:zinc finger protein OZF-like [Calliphora vicina]|uniref:zinc finger protein OZF-like n=1 Tax=Calliphora vicina TaxID=7373 RepID=UPI00325B2288
MKHKMSVDKSCSLCCGTCNEYKSLQNEIYEITIKYFDPVLLTDDDDSNHFEEIKILCQECWLHIKDFHEFQTTVMNTRNVLQEKCYFNEISVEIKQEDVLDNEDEEDVFDKSVDDVNIKNETLEDDNDNNDFVDDVMSIKDDDDQVENEELLISLDKSEEITGQSKDIKSKQSKSRKRRLPKQDTEKSSNQIDKGLESDLFIAEWKPELQCDLCDAVETNLENLRRHFRNIHNARPYIKCCEKKFYRRHLLVDHINFHLNPETHKCDICGKISSSISNLKLHKKNMHENTEQFECEVCHKAFNLKTTLKRHMLQHETGSKDFVCPECGKAFLSEFLQKAHIRTVHNVDRVCDQCGKTIHGKAALKQHLMEHAGIKKPKFPCDHCGAELHSRSSLKRHISALHDDTTVYVCSICGKVAASKNTLLAHKKNVHDEERKYKCTFCDKAFKQPKILREHIASHTGQELYQCPHCPQRFKVSSNMHHHRKRAHPVEWEEGRKKRITKLATEIDVNEVKNQVLI